MSLRIDSELSHDVTLREEMYRALVEAVKDPIFAKDPKGRYVMANASMARVAGREPDEIIGMTDDEIFPMELAGAFREIDEGVMRTGMGAVYEISSDATGSTRHYEVVKGPFRDRDGRVIGVSGVAHDITDRKAAEDAHREQQSTLAHLERLRTLGQMATGLAHELNQPLGAIANYAAATRAMLAAGAPASRAEEIFGEIMREAARAGEIIRRMRAFARKQPVAVQREEANELVRETIDMMAYDLRAAGVVPTLDFARALPAVDADSVQIQQVLVNLVRNAIDAVGNIVEGEKSISVRTAPEGDDHVSIAVVDNGCGIPETDLKRVFDAFYTTKQGGLGVGLALCRTIVEDHRGQLCARRNPAGAGMIFEFTLRRSAPPRSLTDEP